MANSLDGIYAAHPDKAQTDIASYHTQSMTLHTGLSMLYPLCRQLRRHAFCMSSSILRELNKILFSDLGSLAGENQQDWLVTG